MNCSNLLALINLLNILLSGRTDLIEHPQHAEFVHSIAHRGPDGNLVYGDLALLVVPAMVLPVRQIDEKNSDNYTKSRSNVLIMIKCINIVSSLRGAH